MHFILCPSIEQVSDHYKVVLCNTIWMKAVLQNSPGAVAEVYLVAKGTESVIVLEGFVRLGEDRCYAGLAYSS